MIYIIGLCSNLTSVIIYFKGEVNMQRIKKGKLVIGR